MTTIRPTEVPNVDALASVVEGRKRAWQQGESPDAAAVLTEHPELLRHRSLLVDLAYEEYCLREEAGEPLDVSTFCERFPAYRSHLRKVLLGHRLLADNPNLFAAPVAKWPAAGEEFEGLTVVRELGRGSFARAYLARDPETGDRPVVLKLSPNSSAEARTLGQVSHSNIVSVLWAKRVGSMYAICMPYVGSTTLRDALDAAFAEPGSPPTSARVILDAVTAAGAPPGPDRADLLTGRETYQKAVATVGSSIASALDYLHQAGTVHGDIKPTNVVLGTGGQPYLIDFNLSAGPGSSLLFCGGTLPYMAPERIQLMLGDPAAHDPVPVDVYAFGALLFEALSGRLPHGLPEATDPSAAATELLGRQRESGPRLRSANPSVPCGLARLVEQCLWFDPTRRPRAAELAGELAQFGCRGRWAVRAAVASAGAVVLAATVVLANPDRFRPTDGPRQKDPHETPAEVPPPVTADEFITRGLSRLKANDHALAQQDFTEALRRKPDGRTAALLGYCHSRAGQHRVADAMYRRATDEFNYRPAWVLNNRAYALLQLPVSEANLRAAADLATRALGADPTLRPARCNRALARFRLHLDPDTQTLSDPVCLSDVEAVLKDGPFSSGLYYSAALILAAAADGRDEYLARAVRCLRESVALGRNPDTFRNDPLLKRHLSERPDFAEVQSLRPSAAPAAQVNPQLAEPPD